MRGCCRHVILLTCLLHWLLNMHAHTRRLIRTQGSLPSSLLYVAYFLPTSINAAWLSVASGLGVLIVPVSYGGNSSYVEAEAVVLAVVVTAAGKEVKSYTSPCLSA